MSAADAAPARQTLLHLALARAAEEFSGTAEGQPDRRVITFAVPGFSGIDLQDSDRKAFARISAEIGTELAAVVDRGLTEPELIAAAAGAAEMFRTKSGTTPAEARMYEALADTVEVTVYYNRQFHLPHAQLHRAR